MNADEIRATKLRELRRAKAERPVADLKVQARSAPPLRPVPLRREGGLALLADDPAVALAPACEEAQLEAASLRGPGLAAFRLRSPLPAIRLEDVVDEYQLLETRVLPADGVHLAVRLLDRNQLSEYVHHARELGLQVLVEAGTVRELEAAMDALDRARDRVAAIALSVPDPADFAAGLEAMLGLAPRVEGGRTLVSLARPSSAAELALAKAAGLHAACVGGRLWADPDPAKALLAWRGLERRVRPATMEELP